MRIHLVYPHGRSISAPHAIGAKLGERLARRFAVRHYDLTHPEAIVPEPGDVLLGHPDAAAWSVFRRSLGDRRWRRRIAMAPFVPEDYEQTAYLHRIIPRCDLFLAITGQYWAERTPLSLFKPFAPKIRPLDLAVDPADFPRLKQRFSPKGRRRFVYIGHDGGYKNLPYLEEIAQAAPEMEFCWIGVERSRYPHVRPLGRHDFRVQASRDLLASFDFLITVGRADANPTTILEAMSWGLVPVCTPQSGYHREPSIINIPLGDVGGALARIRELQEMDEAKLVELQGINAGRIRDYYNWERFGDSVEKAIESEESPAIEPLALRSRLALLRCEMSARSAFWRYHSLRRSLIRRLWPRAKPHDCASPGSCATTAFAARSSPA